MLVKLWTTLKGAGGEAGEAVLDAQAFRTLEQELRDADRALAATRDELIGMLAFVAAERREVKRLEERLARREADVVAALGAGREDLARRAAAEVAELETRLATRRTELDAAKREAEATRDGLEQGRRRIAEIRREAAAAKRAQVCLRATGAAAIGGTPGAGRALLADAERTLARIRRLRAEEEDRAEAERALAADEAVSDGAALDAELRAAGLRPAEPDPVDAVLARLRARAAPMPRLAPPPERAAAAPAGHATETP